MAKTGKRENLLGGIPSFTDAEIELTIQHMKIFNSKFKRWADGVTNEEIHAAKQDGTAPKKGNQTSRSSLGTVDNRATV